MSELLSYFSTVRKFSNGILYLPEEGENRPRGLLVENSIKDINFFSEILFSFRRARLRFIYKQVTPARSFFFSRRELKLREAAACARQNARRTCDKSPGIISIFDASRFDGIDVALTKRKINERDEGGG